MVGCYKYKELYMLSYCIWVCSILLWDVITHNYYTPLIFEDLHNLLYHKVSLGLPEIGSRIEQQGERSDTKPSMKVGGFIREKSLEEKFIPPWAGSPRGGAERHQAVHESG